MPPSLTLPAVTYTGNQAIQGIGAQLYIGPAFNAASPVASPTYIPILELTEMPFKGEEWDKLDRSNFNSLKKTKEFGKGMLDPGTVDITGMSITTDAGQVALQAALADASYPYMFALQMPLRPGQTTTGDQYTWNALVMNGTQLSSLAPTKDVEMKYSLQNTGPITPIEGS